MNARVKKHLEQVLSHLYINPLEKCNLKCKICYTRKTVPVLSETEILEFINRYEKVRKLETVTFCGGEVFILPYFTGLVNKLTSTSGSTPGSDLEESKGLTLVDTKFVQVITNGTIDRLSEFENPNMVNLIVSLDGLVHYHDVNRGLGNFQKSIGFLQKAQKLGFHTEIFSIVTKQNLNQIDDFEEYIYSNVILSEAKNPVGISEHDGDPSSRIAGLRMTRDRIGVTYHPRKPPAYLLHHPQSNVFGEIDGFDFLTDVEMIKIMQERLTFPPKNLGCYQISLVSDGRVFGCCEGTIPLGRMENDIEYLIEKLKERIVIWERTNTLKNCLGCSQSEFMCGIKKYLKLI